MVSRALRVTAREGGQLVRILVTAYRVGAWLESSLEGEGRRAAAREEHWRAVQVDQAASGPDDGGKLAGSPRPSTGLAVT